MTPGAPPRPIESAADAAAFAGWVVCLCADWCGTCRDYRAVFEQLARAHPGLRFAWVDVEDEAEIADAFDVETFPTLLVGGAAGTHFLGPMLPHADPVARLLAALPPARPSAPHTLQLLAALAADEARYRLRPAA